MRPERLWNANTHYYPLLLNAIPPSATRVLDVGCGDGLLCAELLQAGVRHVVGLDAR
jgi:2-polyprenyl-3-methyl-5-hydroxy-6-metoxy-1,4-benzoquinol methylase